MMALRKTVGLAGFLLSLASGEVQTQGTPDERAACAPDVFRLCRADVPNVQKITDCMERQKELLSTACRLVFTPDLLKSVRAAIGRPDEARR